VPTVTMHVQTPDRRHGMRLVARGSYVDLAAFAQEFALGSVPCCEEEERWVSVLCDFHDLEVVQVVLDPRRAK
jgi:hypothetical protein